MSIQVLYDMNGKMCSCGKVHTLPVKDIIVGSGVVNRIPELVKQYGGTKVFVLSDVNTYPVAGEKVCNLLKENGIAYTSYVLQDKHVEPSEKAVGSVMMHYDYACDLIITAGSGVLNDISKILSCVSKNPYFIVGTAPSMDGYASGSSSMERDGLKISLNTRCADVVIGDIDILATAPAHMLKAGLGDMIAKYTSICEWRMAQILVGEYYCEEIAELVRVAVKRCVDNADGLLKRDPVAIEAVFEGLVLTGVAMAYAGVSRPASGVEHYFSHCWDMRAASFGTKYDLHGIQCGVGTWYAVNLYEKLRTVTPDKQKALAFAKSFDLAAWHEKLHAFLGEGALAMIELEKKEGKYDVEKHAARLDLIVEHWDELLAIMDAELPTVDALANLLETIEAPKTLQEMDMDASVLPTTFCATKDIRDKYVLSRLCWDLGILDEFAESLQ